MALPEPHGFFIDPLERSGLTYCVTGSVAAGIYGEPRITHDVDVVLTISLPQLPSLQTAFPEEEFYLPPVEAILTEVRRAQRGMLTADPDHLALIRAAGLGRRPGGPVR